MADRFAAPSVTVSPSASVNALFTRTGASSTFVNVTLAPAAALLSDPSLTLTSYAGAASPPVVHEADLPVGQLLLGEARDRRSRPHSPPRTARR